MGAVEDPGSAGGGGERRAGEGTERLERGREEGGKEPFEPSVPGLGRALGGDPGRAGEGVCGRDLPGLEWRAIRLTVDPRGSRLSSRCSSSVFPWLSGALRSRSYRERRILVRRLVGGTALEDSFLLDPV